MDHPSDRVQQERTKGARVHVRRRSRQRGGVGLNRTQQAAVIAQIRNGSATYVRPGNEPGRDIYRVTLPGRRSREVVYASDDGVLITVLPMSSWV